MQEYKWVLEVVTAAIQNAGVDLWWASCSFKSHGKTSSLLQQKHSHKGAITKIETTI